MGQYIDKELTEMSKMEYSDDWDIDLDDPDLDELEKEFFTEPKMEEKALPKENPLKEIEQHLDNIRDDITKAMGDLDERELRI